MFLLVVHLFYFCLFSLSVQLRRKYVKTNKEIGDDEKK